MDNDWRYVKLVLSLTAGGVVGQAVSQGYDSLFDPSISVLGHEVHVGTRHSNVHAHANPAVVYQKTNINGGAQGH